MPNEEEIKKLEEQKKALEAEMKAKAEAEAKLKAEEEARKKAEEEAKAKSQANGGEPKADDKKANEEPKPAHSVDDYMLREEFDKRFTPFAEKIDALIGKASQLQADNAKLASDKAQLEADKAKADAEKQELEAQKAEIEAKLKALEDKYENKPFGNVAHGGEVNPSSKNAQYVSFDEYSKAFMK